MTIQCARRTLGGIAVVALALGLVAASAAANRLAFSNRTFRATWNPMTFQNATFTIRCPVTLEGSFHQQTFTKTLNSLIGYVTRATVAPSGCGAEGTIFFLQATLPWHMNYEKFAGTLPNITYIEYRIIELAFLAETGIRLPCLYASTSTRPLFMRLNREAGGVVNELKPLEGFGLMLTEEGICANEVRLSGSAQTYTVVNAATRILLTLVA